MITGLLVGYLVTVTMMPELGRETGAPLLWERDVRAYATHVPTPPLSPVAGEGQSDAGREIGPVLIEEALVWMDGDTGEPLLTLPRAETTLVAPPFFVNQADGGAWAVQSRLGGFVALVPAAGEPILRTDSLVQLAPGRLSIAHFDGSGTSVVEWETVTAVADAVVCGSRVPYGTLGGRVVVAGAEDGALVLEPPVHAIRVVDASSERWVVAVLAGYPRPHLTVVEGACRSGLAATITPVTDAVAANGAWLSLAVSDGGALAVGTESGFLVVDGGAPAGGAPDDGADRTSTVAAPGNAHHIAVGEPRAVVGWLAPTLIVVRSAGGQEDHSLAPADTARRGDDRVEIWDVAIHRADPAAERIAVRRGRVVHLEPGRLIVAEGDILRAYGAAIAGEPRP